MLTWPASSTLARLRPSPPGAAALAFFAAAFLLYAGPALFLLDNYLQPTFDLGIYDQSLWLIQSGETFNTILGAHVVGAHFSPILFLLAPVSLVPGGAAPEIVLQSLLLASGVFPMTRLASLLGRRPLWFMVAYTAHPALIGGSWWGFRPWNLAVPAFAWAVYRIWKRPDVATAVVAGLAMLAFREDLALWVGLVCLVAALAGRMSWADLIVSGLVLASATAAVLFLIVPVFSPVGAYIYFGQDRPLLSLDDIVAQAAGRLLFLFAPLGAAPPAIRRRLVAPLAIPIAALIASGRGTLLFFHYDMMFVPLLLLIVGVSRRAKLRPALAVIGAALVLTTLGALRIIHPRYGPNPLTRDPALTKLVDEVAAAVRAIPGHETASLAAPTRLLPHFSERRSAFMFPSPLEMHTNSAASTHHRDEIRYSCPLPDIVVADSSNMTERWPAVLESRYRLEGEHGRFSVWSAATEQPDAPCSATWREDSP